MTEREETAAPVMHYRSDDAWAPLPEWTEFLTTVGHEVAMLSARDERRPCFGLVLPTQTYAAAFVALGALRFAAGTREEDSASEHFDALFRLRKGAPVRVLEGDRYRRGIITAFEEIGSLRRLQIAMSLPRSGRQRKWYKPEESAKIQAISEDNQEGMSTRRVHRLVRNQPFVSGFLGGEDLNVFGMISSLDCLAITHPARFRREVSEPFLGIRNSQGFHSGSLQDLLRVKEFMQGGHAYHTGVLSPRSRKTGDAALSRSPLVAVYDGLAGFLRLRHFLSSSGWVFLVDRSAPDADEAATFLTQAYLRRSDDIAPSWRTPPAGIEVVCFWR